MILVQFRRPKTFLCDFQLGDGFDLVEQTRWFSEHEPAIRSQITQAP